MIASTIASPAERQNYGMVAWSVTLVVVGVLCGGIGWCIAKYQGSGEVYRLISAEARAVDQKNGAVAERDAEITRRREVEALNNRLVAELAGIAARPPHVIDQAPMIRAIGEAIASAYGSPATTDNTIPEYERTIDFSKVVPESTTETQWFPDVEMDQWLEAVDGFPTTGGWVNRSTNFQTPAPDGQEPVHRLLENGSVTRVDGQPMFRAGDGSRVSPPGGVE